MHENIAYGRAGATREQVERAARRADADTFIRALPRGYDTVLPEDGGTLSQGQRQLLCIARVMLTDPEILLLDEATSSIDTRTERLGPGGVDEVACAVGRASWWRIASRRFGAPTAFSPCATVASWSAELTRSCLLQMACMPSCTAASLSRRSQASVWARDGVGAAAATGRARRCDWYGCGCCNDAGAVGAGSAGAGAVGATGQARLVRLWLAIWCVSVNDVPTRKRRKQEIRAAKS